MGVPTVDSGTRIAVFNSPRVIASTGVHYMVSYCCDIVFRVSKESAHLNKLGQMAQKVKPNNGDQFPGVRYVIEVAYYYSLELYIYSYDDCVMWRAWLCRARTVIFGRYFFMWSIMSLESSSIRSARSL